jgi:hypothetical protein
VSPSSRRDTEVNGEKNYQITAWLLLLATAVLSLVPSGYRPATNIPHALEHFAIYFPAGLAFRLGYSTPYLYRLQLSKLLSFGFRDATPALATSVLGVGIGVGSGAALDRFSDRSNLDR